MRTPFNTVLATLLATLALVGTSSCSSDTDHNSADVSFARDMIPHHRQATEMAALVDDRTQNPDVLSLADRITAAQGPEIETMTGWLESWDEKVPGTMSGMSSMPGMLSDSEMTSLADASGADFDRQFLTLMIQHHEGAIAMAATEESDGANPDAIDLATKIRADQTEEITAMMSLLTS